MTPKARERIEAANRTHCRTPRPRRGEKLTAFTSDDQGIVAQAGHGTSAYSPPIALNAAFLGYE